MCPDPKCRGEDPVQALVDETNAESAGALELSGAIRCTYCGVVWRQGTDKKVIVGRFEHALRGRGFVAA